VKQRNLGSSGLRVSELGLGCNNFGGRLDFDVSRSVIDAALDAGITFLDTADAYGKDAGSERVLGDVLGHRRKDIVLATKFGRAIETKGKRGSSRRYIMSAVEDSLRRLKTDWIDLYQMHYPDPLTPVEESLRALDDLVRDGKVRYIGVSNHQAWQVADAEWTARTCSLNRFVSVQEEYSLVVRGIEREVVPAIRKYGIGLIAYRPLASGVLSGKYKRGMPPPEGSRLATLKHQVGRYLTDPYLETAARLETYAASRGRSLIELAFAWVASHDFLSSLIVGASSADQVRENVAASGWILTAEELAEIGRIVTPDDPSNT